MDRLLRKYAQKYKRAREELQKWDATQRQLLNLFSSAISVLERLPMLMIVQNYGVLQKIDHVTEDLPAKQMESLEHIFIELHKNMDELKRVKNGLHRLCSESHQLLKEEKLEPTTFQFQLRFGVGMSIVECHQGLENLYIMHRDEFNLKVSIIESLTYKSSSVDMNGMLTLLAEQPNIPPDEVQLIFNLFDTGNS